MNVVGLRRYFGATGMTGLVLLAGGLFCLPATVQAQTTTETFAREVERVLPQEELYDNHKRLSQGPVHIARRADEARPLTGELTIPERGWRLIWNRRGSQVLRNAVAAAIAIVKQR